MIIDNRLRNISLLKTRGLDAIAKYVREGPTGRIELGLNGTYLLDYSQSDTPGRPLLNLVSTQNSPINLRLRGSAAWTHRRIGIATFVNYDNSYRDTLSIPNRKVAAWTTLDLQLSYETDSDDPGWLGRTQFALNAQNVLDTYPPFLNNPVGVGYDQETPISWPYGEHQCPEALVAAGGRTFFPPPDGRRGFKPSLEDVPDLTLSDGSRSRPFFNRRSL